MNKYIQDKVVDLTFPKWHTRTSVDEVVIYIPYLFLFDLHVLYGRKMKSNNLINDIIVHARSKCSSFLRIIVLSY